MRIPGSNFDLRAPGRMLQLRRPRGFTLIELMAVSALLVVMVGITTVRWQGFSETSCLRSASRQMGALYRAARCQAMTDGRPRLVEYSSLGGSEPRVRVFAPTVNGVDVEWKAGEGFILAGRVGVQSVIQAHRDENNQSQNLPSAVWIGSDGLARSHVILLGLQGKARAAVLIDGMTGEDRLVLIEDPTLFDPRGLLEGRIETTGTHSH
jgi:prepilin-type N-terminal cleavage/methylation domain-containing protein